MGSQLSGNFVGSLIGLLGNFSYVFDSLIMIMNLRINLNKLTMPRIFTKPLIVHLFIQLIMMNIKVKI